MLNGILAILTMVWAVILGGGVGGVEVPICEVAMEVSVIGIEWHIDPVFLVWTEAPASAAQFCNLIIMDKRLKGSPKEKYIFHHELNHVRQFQALGAWAWPAGLLLPMEAPPNPNPSWDVPENDDSLMWLPPAWLPRQWHFLSVGIRFGG